MKQQPEKQSRAKTCVNCKEYKKPKKHKGETNGECLKYQWIINGELAEAQALCK